MMASMTDMTNRNPHNLPPCRYCKGEELVESTSDSLATGGKTYYIECVNCGACSPAFHFAEFYPSNFTKPREAWIRGNSLPPQPDNALVEALDSAIKELRTIDGAISDAACQGESVPETVTVNSDLVARLEQDLDSHRSGQGEVQKQDEADLAAENEKLLAAAVIFYGCLKDLEELGATVAVCGVDPEVVRIIESRIATECGEISTCLKCGHEQPLKSQFDPCDACGHTWGSLSKQTNTALLDQMAELLADSKCIPCDVEPTTVPCDHCNRKKELLALYHQSKRGEEDA